VTPAQVLLCVLPLAELADDTHPRGHDAARALARVVVVGRRENLVGEAISASQGVVGTAELGERARLRTGDLVEYVPGMVATQHSGSGKANQYFLRGFNLDHGTDFATFVDGMPVNLRSHGHGQGYTDLNFLIAEMVDELRYRKGPYYADVGDFGSAGSASFRIAETLPVRAVEVDAGSFGYRRAVTTGTASYGALDATWGAEAQGYDGPWRDIDEDVRRRNAALKLAAPLGDGRVYALVMGYENRWSSPDQIPQRAIDQQRIDRLGSIDTTLGGDSSRHSISGGWRGTLAGGRVDASAYRIDYDLSLYSNFTYLLDDSERGDQFRQFDERHVTGAQATWERDGTRGSVRAGAQFRRDDIAHVGLSRTQARAFVAPVRDDVIDERSVALFIDGELRFGERLRGYAGLRYEHFDFDVRALQPENSGDTDAGKASPKASLIYQVASPIELYLSCGRGLHSNDARGTTIRVDPVTGDPVERVDPLVASRGTELGARWFVRDRFQATLALWRLDLDSELLFVGDAGNTEASRPSTRRGLEVGLYGFGRGPWRAELEASRTLSRFDGDDPAGSRVPGALPLVVSAGVSGDFDNGWFANARLRHIAEYPLIEDGSVESDGATILNLRVGKRFEHWIATLDMLNALDSRDHDIDYYYASRLAGEPAGGVDDIHFHAYEPRAIRLSVSRRF
jgi:hypothetical protein